MAQSPFKMFRITLEVNASVFWNINEITYHQGKVKRSVIKLDSVLQAEGFGFVQSYASLYLLGDASLFPSAAVTVPNHPHSS